MNTLQITRCDELLHLHPDKVIYWTAKKTLLVADVHIGKEHVLGRAGISIPGGVSEETLNHLFALVDHYSAERLLVLGDFVHGYHTSSESWFEHLKVQQNIRSELTLQIVAGNHDKLASRDLLCHNIEWITRSLFEAPFVFAHEPHVDERGYLICGHLHPAYNIQSKGKEKLRAPVFWFQQNLAVLPAFGHFTGGKGIKPNPGDELFIIGPDCVVSLRH